MHTIATNVLGVFVLEDGTVIEYKPFPDDPEDVAAKIDGQCEEEERLAKEYDGLERRQHDALELGRQTSLIETAEQLHQRQHDVAQAFTRDQIDDQHNRDQLLVQASRSINELDEMANRLIERLRPWYSIYFPELDDTVSDHRAYAAKIAETFDREDLGGEDSTGMDIDDRDRDIIQDLAERVLENYRTRDRIETYVTDLAEQIAPNLSAVLGKLLAARMIALAGSLEDLAKMPSSTIQVLGAEKALFRHMRGEGSAPKHGILFMHEHVRNLPDSRRGKMARFIANKASIAARLDHFDGDFKGNELRQEIDDQREEIDG